MDDLKNEDNIKNEEYLKKGDGFENCPPLPFPWKITWHLYEAHEFSCQE